MQETSRSDRNSGGVARAPDVTRTRARQDRESGQAMVEFALILLPLLLLVAGIIQFGIGLNYWLDMQRIANQGARWAAVNCGQAASNPSTFNPCDPSLPLALVDQAITSGLQNGVCVEISYPAKTTAPAYSGKNIGDPVRVALETDFDLVPLLGVGSLNLRAKATMRLEQVPDEPGLAEVSCP